MKISCIGTTITKVTLSLINAILILIIVLNILLLLSEHALKNEYPSIMDYTYLTINENDLILDVNKGDLLILDTKKAFTINNVIYYKEDYNNKEIGKVTEINVSTVTVKNRKMEDNTTKSLVIGTVIVTIPKVGAIVDIIFRPLGLFTSIVILIVVTIIQNILTKKNKSDKQPKPDFKSIKNS